MHDELIKALGGNVAVAEAVSVSRFVVANWCSRGVSWRYRPAVAKLAAERGVDLPAGYWDSAK